MSRIERFLDKLEDFELAAFYKYRFDTFIPNTQQIILHELKQRNINITLVDKLIESASVLSGNMDKKQFCPRCYSNQFYRANETDIIYEKWSRYELNNSFKTCLVCLYSEEKDIYKKEKSKGWSIFSTIKFLNKRGK